MALTKDEVKKIAQLARLSLTEAELGKYQNELSNILNYVGQLDEVDTDGVEPTAQVTGLKNVTRKDSPGELLAQPAELLKCSVLFDEEVGQIVVPNVFSN